MRRFFRKTWVKVTLGILGCLAVLFLAAYGTFRWLYIPSVPEPEFAEPADQIEAWSQDLELSLIHI